MTLVRVYAALLVLLAATIGAAYLPLGRLALPAAFAIAFAKTGLVMVYFMHLRTSPRLVWIYAGAGGVWLLIATVLTFADYLTRPPGPT